MFKTKILKLDSSKATKYYNEQKTVFEFALENPISVTSSESIVYSLISAYIPYSFYSVNANNHFLDVKENINNIITMRTIQIPNGNYSAVEYSRLLMSLLNTATISYSIVYNKNNNTFTISTVAASTSSIFLFETGPNHINSCHSFVGFPKLDTVINHDNFQSGMINMNDLYYFQIHTDIGSSNNLLTSDNTDGLLDIVPCSDSPLNFISYNPINPSKFLLHSNTLNNIRIGLTDNMNRVIDLNGIPYLLTIRIDIVDSEEHKIAVAQGREQLDLNSNKTNLEIFMRNPEMVNKVTPQNPLNLSDMIEYQLVKNMLKKIKKSKK